MRQIVPMFNCPWEEAICLWKDDGCVSLGRGAVDVFGVCINYGEVGQSFFGLEVSPLKR